MMKFGIKRRADGKPRTVKPTKAAVKLLRQVRDFFKENPGRWTAGWGGNETMCVLHALSHFAHPEAAKDGWYPGHLVDDEAEVPSSVARAARTATLMLIETVNGDPAIVNSRGEVYVDHTPVYHINDRYGLPAVTRALNNTIKWAEDTL